ncbi:MAG TPA: hypothetical protein VHX64_11685, partial [Caulobacteraceae bacterium]|nr:hypothetical protein [Caulobacteraceae bacterium]
FVNDDEVLTHVFLKASFKPGPAGGASWTTRYICCTHQPVSFKGDDGLTANGGQALKETLTHELQGAVELMLHDVAGGRARDEHSAVTLETYVPFLRRKWKLKAYKLSEDDNSIVVATKASNLLVYAGVQQIDKAAITPEPAAPGAK